MAYRKEMSDQISPMRLEYVLGFLISFRHTMIRIRRVITLAGGISLEFPPSGAPAETFPWSSPVEPVGPSF